MANPTDSEMNSNDRNLTTVKGMVEIIHFSSGTFTAGKMRRVKGGADNGDQGLDASLVSFTAPQELKINSQVILHGKWGEHKLYGQQFRATEVEYDFALDSAGLSLWLQKNKDIRGVGPAKAKIIADTFGEQFDQVIRENPREVAKAARLTADAVDNLRTVWIANQDEIALITYLAAFGLSIHEIDTLRSKYGHNTVGVLRSDPYLIIGAIPGFAFKKVDKIALKTGIEKDKPSRIDHGILWCLKDAEDSGHTYLTYDELVNKANTLLELDGLNSRILIAERCKVLATGAFDAAIQIIMLSGEPGNDDEYTVNAVMRTETWKKEVWLHRLIDGLEGKTNEPLGDKDPSTTISSLCPNLNPGQFSAVLNAVIHRISLISGGAGTGKTYTVDSIKRYYLKHDQKVVLCAPTGKAARRLEEVTGHEASTIHRLLGYDGRGFTADPSNPIAADVLVIDEFSMVDSSLAYYLFQAIDWQKTTVVLVGDHNQLPPVGPGNMLRDLVESGAISTTILDTVVRQAGMLKTNCCALLQGTVSPNVIGNSSSPSPWQIVDSMGDADNCRLWIEEVFTNMLKGYPGLDVIHGLQILAPMKDRECGVNRLNVVLQRIYQQVKHRVVVEPIPEGRRPKFYQHDKVIQTANDYKIGVMNGTIGVVVGVEPNGTLHINFEGSGEPVEISTDKKKNLSLAYALTIHKCQGSEFPFVILVIHKSQSFMHSRNLIYTGATRAKKKLIIVGDAWGIRNSVKKINADQRKTWFGELLRRDRERRELLSS